MTCELPPHYVLTLQYLRESKFMYWVLFILTFYLYIRKDLDECGRSLDNCEQNCSNTVGSFECSCQPGYQPVAGAPNRCEGMYETCYFCSVVKNWRWGRPKNYSIVLAYFDDVFLHSNRWWYLARFSQLHRGQNAQVCGESCFIYISV